ncbi:ACS4 protein [Thecamonas trahens ATCC 50062]|uniref:ACS4 protein n=1 Tax=Thecamonas trahens ATCC 50062 TaxID=461836 RepID=A0A0L0DBZ9_THETB|nr:ACS4 protein [Thecamonas trahens ATCC 50062]KNC49765.1 ACS4 protein [Thecamonas trahens ATCC 50062]|eukprot:XP_013757550.1 ACS4 protein [Thecamonas trahens ATCC 50062]
MTDAFVAKAPSVAHALQRAFTLYDDAPFLGTGRTNESGTREYVYTTYKEVGAEATQLACAMSSFLGLPRGAKVGLCAENRPQWLVVDFACVFDAFVSVGLHTSWPQDEIQAIMAETEMEAVVCSYDQAGKFIAAAAARSAASSGAASSSAAAGSLFGLNQMMAASGINSMMGGGVGGTPGLGGADPAAAARQRRRILDSGSEPRAALPKFKYLIVMGYATANAEAAATGEPLFGGVTVPASLQIFDYDLLAGRGLHSAPGHVCCSHTGLSTSVPIEAASGSTTQAPDELTTIMYSSGTSGAPKGIPVSAARWKNDALHGGIGQCTDKVAVSYMPLAHGADRDFDDLLEDMRAVRPRFMLGLSHFWNRVYDSYRADLAARVVPDPHFAAALAAAAPSAALEDVASSAAVHELVDAAVAKTRWGKAHEIRAHAALRAALGGELIFVVTGGAHTSDKVKALMAHVLVPGNEERVHDAYGTTEFPGISVNGALSPDVDVRLVDVPEMGYLASDLPFPRGEILVRAKDPSVMTSGYFKNADATAAALLAYTPGEPQPRLRIIDRRSNVVELYVSGRSVWVPAASLEASTYAATPGVARLALCADRNADRLVAVVVPTAAVAALAPDLARKTILAELEAAGSAANLPLEHIPADVVLDTEPWSVANGMLSALGKVRRGAVGARHKEALDRIYATLETLSEDTRLQARQERAQWRASGGGAVVASPAPAAAPVCTGDVCVLPPGATGGSGSSGGTLVLAMADALASQSSGEPPSQCEDPHGLDAMNAALAVLRNAASVIADRTPKWNAAAVAKLEAASAALKSTERATRADVARALASFAPYASESLVPTLRKLAIQASVAFDDASPAASASAGLARVNGALVARKLAICVATFKVKVAKQLSVPEKEERWREFRAACAALVEAGKCYGFEVPFWLTSFPGWIFPPDDGAGADGGGSPGSAPRPSRAPAMVFGSASVWCTGCGLLVEETINDWGTFRAVSLDSEANYCAYCWKLLPALADGLDAPGVEASVRSEFLAHVYPDSGAAFAFDAAHPAHLRHKVFPASLDGVTPADVLTAAAEVFSTRLALGVPDPSKLQSAPALAPLTRQLRDAGLLVEHDSYLWLTYKVMYELAAGLAEVLGGMGVLGQFVGISGPNAFEVALLDMACALSGAGSFGIHTTYTCSEASAVLANASPVVVGCAKQVVASSAVTELAGWSLEALEASALGSVQHVIVLDADGDEELPAFGPKVAVQRLATLLTPTVEALARGEGRGVDGFKDVLPEPRLCRGVASGHEHIFTLLYTSGSSGAPKGVMVTPQSFVNDLSEPSSSWPLITVSYIPLSHSSDRMKMWEFVAKGGRVGFAHYGASNWREHETAKKDKMLVPSGRTTNNVEALFELVAALKPSAMACPPRIWAGLHAVWVAIGSAAGSRDAADLHIQSLFGPRIAFLATGGAPTAPHLVEWVKSVFPAISFVDSYGTTETGGITSNGYVLTSKGVEVKLDPLPELFPDAPVGSVGELLVRTPNLNLGYYGVGEFGSGWYATGDVAQYDSIRGTYTIVERVSALRKSGPALVALNGLETLYTNVDGVDDVFIEFSDSGKLVAFVTPSEAAAAADPATAGVLRRGFRDAALAAGLGDEHVPASVVVVDYPFDRASGLLGGSLKKNRSRFRERFAGFLDGDGDGSASESVAQPSEILPDANASVSVTVEPAGDDAAASAPAKVALGTGSSGTADAVPSTTAAGESDALWTSYALPAVAGVGLVATGALLAVLIMRRK